MPTQIVGWAIAAIVGFFGGQMGDQKAVGEVSSNVAVLDQRVNTNEESIKDMKDDIKFIRDAVTSLVAKQEIANKLPAKK